MEKLLAQYFLRKELNDLLFQSILDRDYALAEELLQAGADPNTSHKFDGHTIHCLELQYSPDEKLSILISLLNHGANPNFFRMNGGYVHGGCLLYTIESGQKKHIEQSDISLPTDYDQDMAKIKTLLATKGSLNPVNINPPKEVPPFRRGKQNPEKMENDFYKYMVTQGVQPYHLRRLIMEGNKRATIGGNKRKRKQKNATLNQLGYVSGPPVWNYQRFGTSSTILPDGSIVHIGGEHEDYYDPDFCIFNDVLKVDSKGQMELFFYPESVFPPTDFHTATLYEDQIIIIGGIGYQSDRRDGVTNVYVLNLSDFSINKWASTGQNPGWIYRHSALFDKENDRILVFGGESTTEKEVKDVYCFYIKEKRWENLGQIKQYRET